MPGQNRTFVVVGLCLVIALAVVLFLRSKPSKESVGPVDVGTYYNGPRRSKKDPNVWVMPDGKVVPPPAGAETVPTGQGGPKLDN